MTHEDTATRVVFLDVDGVLATSRSVLRTYNKEDETLLFDPSGRAECIPLEKRCVAELKRIVLSTGASIVLTTQWRLSVEQRSFLVQMLEQEGLVNVVVGDTWNLNTAGRGDEIRFWLNDHPEFLGFVVIEHDDKHLRSFERCLPLGHIVKTEIFDVNDSSAEGLTTEKADEAISILNRTADLMTCFTETNRHFGIIRHSVRLDSEADADWEDRNNRPYDTPISDFDLPQRQAEAMKKFGFNRIVSSPFRRCLQTAAVIAKTLEIAEVEVYWPLGEAMPFVQRDSKIIHGDEFSYLSGSEMDAILRMQGVHLGRVFGDAPSLIGDGVGRFQDAIRFLLEEKSDERFWHVLAVTHGDIVNAAVEMVTGETIIEIDFCGWAVWQYSAESSSFDVFKDSAQLVGNYGYMSLVLS